MTSPLAGQDSARQPRAPARRRRHLTLTETLDSALERLAAASGVSVNHLIVSALSQFVAGAVRPVCVEGVEVRAAAPVQADPVVTDTSSGSAQIGANPRQSAPNGANLCGTEVALCLKDKPKEPSQPVQKPPVQNHAERPDLERALDVAMVDAREAASVKGETIRSEVAYRQSIRERLVGDDAAIAAWLDGSELARRRAGRAAQAAQGKRTQGAWKRAGKHYAP